MLGDLFMKLTRYEFFRRLIWKPVYETLAGRFKIDNWHFMNYGYVPAPNEAALTLQPEDEINRYPAQLYHYLAVRTSIEGKEVLEVGSGRGGGASYIARYLRPKTMTGLDLAQNAVDLANATHRAPGLQYVQGNAENLPFPDAQFDVVINVESCHAYGSVPNFLTEVRRVLRPGGVFLCTDMRGPEGTELLRSQLRDSGMDWEEETDITDRVVAAIEAEEPMKQQRIEAAQMPEWMLPAFREFAGVKNSVIHRDLKNRALIYQRWKLRKK